MTYEAVIGLEVHCQLQTESKAFSPDSAAFGAGPNGHIDPISLGHPGTLPVLNVGVLERAVRMGLATDCTIAPRSVLARKHYFYPDLPKGYQISQYETPLCADGHLDVPSDDGGVRRIGITRIHLEEDAGKSVHDQDPVATLLDYNRCGVPLIEIVSEPDLRTPREAYHYVKSIRQIVRYLGICDGNMEEGSLRCDANVSIRPVGETALGTKTEVKNMNSFRHVERALAHEITRQIETVTSGGVVVQETLLWDADAEVTRPMRSKEAAHDYRYFPDPDLPPIVVDAAWLEVLRGQLPEMAEARAVRYERELNLSEYDAAQLTEERAVADYFEAALDSMGGGPDAAKALANVIMTHVQRVLKEDGCAIDSIGISPARLSELVALRQANEISSTGLQQLFETMRTDTGDVRVLAQRHDLIQVSDDEALLPIIDAVIAENPRQVTQYAAGKPSLIGFFIGQVMRRFDGSPDPQRVRTLLAERLPNPEN